MKRVKIIKKFADLERYNRIYPSGTVYDVTDERAKDLLAKGFVELIGDVVVTEYEVIEQAVPKEIKKETAKLTVTSKPKPKRNVKKRTV